MATGRIPINGTAAIQETIVDAKGDLIVGTGADAVARLAVGTNGHTLVADSDETTGLKWAAPSSANPSFSLLSTTNLSGASTFTITGLSGYNTLYMIIKNASAAAASNAMRYRINSNTGDIYRSYGLTINMNSSYSNAIATQNVIETTSLSLGVMSSNAGSQVSGFVRLEGCNSSGIKMVHSASGVGSEGSNDANNRIVGGFIDDSAVVSSITFFTDGASNFDVGTLRIYGSVA